MSHEIYTARSKDDSMSHEIYTALILSFAKIMVGKQIQSNVVCKVLGDICDFGNFDGGMVYEIDQNNVFHIQEHHVRGEHNLCTCFSMSDINALYRKKLAEDVINFIDTENTISAHERDLLDLFSSTSLVVVSMVNEEYRINGFIVFFMTSGMKKIFGGMQEQLAILLHMLKRYLNVRIYQNKLVFVQRSFESLLDNTGIDVYITDFYTHEVLYVNKSMAEPYGGAESFTGKKCWEVLFPGQNRQCAFCPQNKIVDDSGNPTNVYSWDYQRQIDGEWFRVFSAAFWWKDGRLTHVISSANISENKRNEDLIKYLANNDSLTGLPNRRSLIRDCAHWIEHAHMGDRGYLLFFDIDGFKAINDSFGHSAGDDFLVQLGAFFSSIPLLKNAIYRNGGDEFVALLDERATDESIIHMVGEIHARFKQAWNLKDTSVFCNVSVGVACYPEDGTTAEALLNKADQAMYHIKKNGGASLCFGRELA